MSGGRVGVSKDGEEWDGGLGLPSESCQSRVVEEVPRI